jgi:hypothetical protein
LTPPRAQVRRATLATIRQLAADDPMHALELVGARLEEVGWQGRHSGSLGASDFDLIGECLEIARRIEDDERERMQDGREFAALT